MSRLSCLKQTVYLLVIIGLLLPVGVIPAQAEILNPPDNDAPSGNFRRMPEEIGQQPAPPARYARPVSGENPPPDEDYPYVLPGVSSALLLSRQKSLSPMAVVGGSWTAQGPAPVSGGQVEHLTPRDEVVGAIHALAAHPANPDILYAGTVNGGIWRTDNATDSSPHWIPLTDHMPSLSISALEFDPSDTTSNTLLAGIGRYSSMGSVGGPRSGLLYTTDGGITWMPISGGSGGVSLIGKNVSGVAPRGSTFVVSVNFSEPYTCPNFGLFRSTDTGGTFVKVGPPGVAFDLAGDPAAPNVLYAGLTYVSFCGGTSNGIYKSTDTGATWTKISTAAMDALIVDGTTNNIEIAAYGGNVFVNILQGGQTAGIFYSGDSGTTWNSMDRPLIPASSPAAISNVTPGAPIRITTGSAHNLANGNEVQIAGVTGTTGANGLHTITVVNATQFDLNGTSDSNAYTGGGTWEKVVGTNPTFKPGGQGGIHASLRVDPSTPTTVYIGGDRQDGPFPNYIGAGNYTGSLYRGDSSVAATGTAPSPQWDHLTHSDSIATMPNGGTTSSSAPHADSREMVFDANGNIIETDDGGIYRRTNPQANTGDWVTLNGDLQILEAHSVAYDSLSHTIISGNQDNGTTYQPSAGATVWQQLTSGDGGDVAVDNLVLAGSSQSVRYSSFQNLGWLRRSVWDANGNFVSWTGPSLNVTSGPALVPQFCTPIATSEFAGNRLLVGGWNTLYESTDGGNNITDIGSARFRTTGCTLGDNTLAYGANNNPDVIYAVGYDTSTGNNVVAVRTAGAPGTPVTFSSIGVAGATRLLGVAVDPHNDQVAFVIDANQVFQTTDAGTTWTDITGSLSDPSLHSIATAPGLLLVGGSMGVHILDLSTGIWNELGSGLPNTLIWSLDYDDQDGILVASAFGRGVWLLPLYSVQVTKTATPASASTGDVITYTYNIVNNSVITLNPVVAVDDVLGPVPLASTTLPPGASTTGILNTTVISSDLPGPLVNTVIVSGTASLRGVITATDTASVTLVSSPAIEIGKSASVITAAPGDTITYTYRVTNTGDVSLGSITATDDQLGPVTLGAASLAPGASTSGVLTYTVVEGDLPGPLVNTVTVTGTPPAGNPVTGTDTVSVTLLPAGYRIYLPLVIR